MTKLIEQLRSEGSHGGSGEVSSHDESGSH